MMSKAKSIRDINADLFQPEEDDRYCDPKEIRRKAMDYLARREYGQDELARKLESTGFDAAIIADEVARLTDEGLQSDQRYAESFVQSRISQGKGPLRIREELRQRGLKPSAVDAAIDDAGQDWFELARQVRVRKFGADLPEEFPARAKQMRFLQYRGFDTDQVQVAVRSHGDDPL